jgi:hypothetical protein
VVRDVAGGGVVNCPAAYDRKSQHYPCQLQLDHEGPHRNDFFGFWWAAEDLRPPSDLVAAFLAGQRRSRETLPVARVADVAERQAALPKLTAAERSEFSTYAAFWAKYRPKTKNIQHTHTRPPERFRTQYVDGIGWLTAREAEWLDDPDSNLSSNGDRIGHTVDARFNTAAPYAHPDDNGMAVWPITGREIRPKRVPWMDDE